MNCIYDFLEACSERVSYGVSQGFIGAFSSQIDLKNFLPDMAKEVARGLPDMVREVAGELDRAMKEGITGARFGDNIKLLGNDIGHGLVEVISDFYKRVFFKATPWVVLSGAAAVGTPFFISYIYYRVKHNIGRPELAREVKYVDLYSRVMDGTLRTVAALWDATQKGVTWGSTAAASVGSIVLVSEITDTNLDWLFGHVGVIAGGAAGIGAFSSLAKQTYQAISRWRISREQPIFNETLTEKVDGIIAATKNLRQNGGYLQNILFYGPAGTGKTMVSKKIAEETGVNYIEMSGGDLAQYIKRGDHVTELNKLFAKANNTASPTILFIDEAESLCRKRDDLDKSELLELLNAFLKQTGESSKQVMVILATNRMEDLDPAVLSRMDHKLLIGLPELAERQKILKQYIQKFFSEDEQKVFFDNVRLNWMSSVTEGMTGRALFKMINALAAKKSISSDNQLTKQMIDAIVNDFIEQEIQVGALGKRKVEQISNPITLQVERLFQSLRDFFIAFFNPLHSSF